MHFIIYNNQTTTLVFDFEQIIKTITIFVIVTDYKLFATEMFLFIDSLCGMIPDTSYTYFSRIQTYAKYGMGVLVGR